MAARWLQIQRYRQGGAMSGSPRAKAATSIARLGLGDTLPRMESVSAETAGRFGLAVERREGVFKTGAYKVWVGNRNDDVYLLHRTTGDRIKVSLHPNIWKIEPSRGDAAHARRLEWTPADPDEEGKVLALRLLVSSRAAVYRADTLDRDIEWYVLPPEHRAAEFRLWLTPYRNRVLCGPWVELVAALKRPLSGQLAIVTVAPRIEFPSLPPLQGPTDLKARLSSEAATQYAALATVSFWGVSENVGWIIDGHADLIDRIVPD